MIHLPLEDQLLSFTNRIQDDTFAIVITIGANC
jgi:hypothetical protein